MAEQNVPSQHIVVRSVALEVIARHSQRQLAAAVEHHHVSRLQNPGTFGRVAPAIDRFMRAFAEKTVDP
jgi:hypothetical protein